MNSEILHLEPLLIWKNFYSILNIPRRSGNEETVIQFVKKFGDDLGLPTMADQVGNVIIKKPATPGMENRKTVILQGHLDMVAQKGTDSVHNFDTDPIQVHIDGEWLRARETTLGADNGIGVAAILSVLESGILKVMQEVYQKKFESAPQVKAIHAGLECGLFGMLLPDLDMISIGPTICYPHSLDEKVFIPSVGRFWDFLNETLNNIPLK
ncbi:MAG: hypothetical protein NTV01_20740 [Bacteroidia bacterium]|nr:hypothetical protein [Bacteroidia bacterium]